MKIFLTLVFLINLHPYKIMPIEIGRLVFIDAESGSSIYINSIYFGKAPILVKIIKTNEALIKIEGFTGFAEEKFLINENIREVYMYKPVFTVYKTVLKIITKPESAMVYIDDKAYNMAPLIIEDICSGKHTIEIISKGYKPTKEEINVKKNRINEKVIELKKIFLLKFSNKLPDDAIIQISDNKQTVSFSPQQDIYLDNGDYEIIVNSQNSEQSQVNFKAVINNNDYVIDYKPILKKSRIVFKNLKKNSKIFDDSDITDKIINGIYLCETGSHKIFIKEKSGKKLNFNLNISAKNDSTVVIN